MASGVEDYYVDGSEPDGVWIGVGGIAIGATGPVTADALHHVLGGFHPGVGVALGRHVAKRVPGFDVTFSAPKSVSVLFGVEWTPVRNGIANVVGVPPAVMRAFSRRRAEIESELARSGQSGARAAQTAALETRRRKDRDAPARDRAVSGSERLTSAVDRQRLAP